MNNSHITFRQWMLIHRIFILWKYGHFNLKVLYYLHSTFWSIVLNIDRQLNNINSPLTLWSNTKIYLLGCWVVTWRLFKNTLMTKLDAMQNDILGEIFPLATLIT